MRSTVSAGVARDELLAALRPFLERAVETLPVLSVPGVGASVLVQTSPTVARLLVEGPATACPALLLTGPEIPGEAELAAAAEQFIGAGLSACPPSVVDGVMAHAAKPGAGLVLWVRPLEGEVDCLLALSRVPLDRAQRLFSVAVVGGANPLEPAATVTVH
jgi:hypothetical protein